MAFTLIELLTVVAIVSILAALLLPVANRASLSGKQASSVQRLRGLQIANIQYAAEHDGQFVSLYRRAEPGEGGADQWWHDDDFQFLPLLIPDPQNYWWGNPPKALCSGLIPMGLSKQMTTSFGINSSIMEWREIEPNGRWLPFAPRQAGLRNASRVMAFAESQDLSISMDKADAYTLPEKQVGGAIAYRYRNMANIVFYDGHVEQLSKEQIVKNNLLWKGEE